MEKKKYFQYLIEQEPKMATKLPNKQQKEEDPDEKMDVKMKSTKNPRIYGAYLLQMN